MLKGMVMFNKIDKDVLNKISTGLLVVTGILAWVLIQLFPEFY